MFQERECYTSKSLGGESKNLHCKREFIIRDDVRLLVAVTDVRQYSRTLPLVLRGSFLSSGYLMGTLGTSTLVEVYP